MKSHFNLRRCSLAASLFAALALVTLVVLPAAAEGSADNHLVVNIVASNPGPLPACSEDGSDCGLANSVRHFIYVTNNNSLPTRLEPASTSRATFPNALVVSRIDDTIFVDGVETYDFYYTP